MIWQVGLYVAAVLIPLAAFAVEAIFIRQLKRLNAYIATGAIGLSCLLSLIGFLDYTIESNFFSHHAEVGGERGGTTAPPRPSMPREPKASAHHKPLVWSGSVDWVILGGRLPRPRETSARLRRSPTWRFPWASRSTI